MVICLLEKG